MGTGNRNGLIHPAQEIQRIFVVVALTNTVRCTVSKAKLMHLIFPSYSGEPLSFLQAHPTATYFSSEDEESVHALEETVWIERNPTRLPTGSPRSLSPNYPEILTLVVHTRS